MAKQFRQSRIGLNELTQVILVDKEIADFITSDDLTQEQINRSLPKFNQFMVEREELQNQDESYIAKGYKLAPSMNEGCADVIYLETRELVEAKKRQDIKNRVTLVGSSVSLKHISTNDLDLGDPNCIEIYNYLNDYQKNFGTGIQKGLYVFGNFGVGKFYLTAYLANCLPAKYGKSTTLPRSPTFCIDIKNVINTGTAKEQADQIKQSEISVLDDIGTGQ